MAKDYFEDVIPPASVGKRQGRSIPVQPTINHDIDSTYTSAPKTSQTEDSSSDDQSTPDEFTPGALPTRGIRNINVPSRPRLRMASDMRQLAGSPPMRPPYKSTSHLWIWIVAGICIVALILFAVLAMRATVVSVTPRSHTIVFDQSAQFVAYPSATAASGTLPYTVQTLDLNDSEVIPAQSGVTHVETKASGTVTLYNDYSTSPVRLIATTRFETPDHLIFRTPNDISIPGKKGTTPGQVDVTIIADQAGQQYNSTSTVPFTVPGLKSNPAMYKGVHAQSAGQMIGGFSGDRASTDPATRASAVADIRSHLQEAALKQAQTDGGPNGAIFTSLMQTTYQDLPDTNETNGVGIHESIHVVVPVFPADMLAQLVGANVTSDTENVSLKIVPGNGYTAVSTDEASGSLGSLPLHFTLAGNATLVWNVDTEALTKALSGKDQAAFKGIIANFPGIQEARARIEPFWKSTFPTNPKDIRVDILDPKKTQGAGK